MTSKNARSRDDVSNTRAGAEQGHVTSFTASQKCCSRVGCSKYGLFVINFLVWAAGGVLMGVGTWSRLRRNELDEFDNVTVDVAYLLIGIGAVMFVVSLFGCLGALRDSLCLLRVFIVAVVLVFVGQMVAGVLAFVMLDSVEESMTDFMRQTIAKYHTQGSSIDLALDHLQKNYSCCGGTSYKDWDYSPLYNCSSNLATACDVPEACCLTPAQECGNKVRRYSEEFAALTIQTRGCIGALMAIFKDNLVIIGLIAFVVGFLQVCSLLMAHILIKYIASDGKFSL